MTKTARHDDDRTPTWIVQSVFDPDGEGHDFAYTIGLHDLGHPELHLWARPSLGDDPGADWSFSPRDRTGILNELAWQVIDGDLEVGAQFEMTFDGGEATAAFRVDPPGDTDQLQAFHVHPDAHVLPLRWALHRQPEGPSLPLRAREATQAKALHRALMTAVDRERPAPDGWRLPSQPRWTVTQRYGPLTPVVVARAAQLWQADVTAYNVLLRAASDVMTGGSLTWPATIAKAAARRAGRTHQLERLHDDVHDLVDELTTGERWQPRWAEVEQSLWGDAIVADPELAHRAIESDLTLLTEVTEACLLAEAVADVVDPSVLVAARGPWDVALSRPRDVPAERQASPEILAVIVDLLRPLPLAQLRQLAARHRAAGSGEAAGSERYAELACRLRGWAFTGPAACPWEGTLDELPAWHSSWSLALGVPVHVETPPLEDLHEWATVMTSALCHRARLTADDVTVLCRPARALVPGLEPMLNRPVARSLPREGV